MKDTPGLLVGTPIVIGSLLLLHAALRVDPTERNVEYMPDMAYSTARKSGSESGVFPLGMTLQPLVQGTVVRGSFDFPFGVGPEEALRAGREVVNSIHGEDPGVQERGANRYAIFCSHCHGNGVDAGIVSFRGMVPPPSLLGARAKGMSDGEMFHVITKGQGNMKAHGPQVPVDDRWKIIHHVRALQRRGN